ncbi:MAG TPA: hypothetical protein VMB48_11110 [Steroidobacteraceae bacterium]|nr:hypothetical protein [Steroidobacteraceae bacterium]
MAADSAEQAGGAPAPATQALRPAAASAGAPAGTVELQSAHWETRKLSFTYSGFTTRYSCDGLEDAVRQLLLVTGARKQDLHIHSIGCVHGFGYPEPFPGVEGTFSVLVPDTAQPPAAGAVSAQWQPVDLVRDRGLQAFWDSLYGGDCELLEQFQRRILPLFSTRNLNYRSSCFPYTATLGAITLKLQVLKAVPAGPS